MGHDELFESVATALASFISLKFGPVADPHRRHADPIWPPQSQNRISSSPRSKRPYRGAEILGRLFWDFRQAVGRDIADKFVVGAWKEFSSRSAAQSPKEFLTIFAQQFEQGTGATYISGARCGAVITRPGVF
jgi:hypothetical protein